MKNRPATKGPAKPGGKVFSELLGPGNYPLAYYNMPKAACTTIKNLLYYIKTSEWHPDPLDIHQGIRLKGQLLRNREFMLHRQESQFDRPFMVFTFVREPGRRVYSTFVEKFWATGKYSFKPFRKHLQQHFGYTLPPLENGRSSIEEVRNGFKQFLRFAELNLAGQTVIPPNAHWASQFQRVRKLKPADYTSFIGRVESFASDMSFVLSKAGWSDLSITGKRFNEGPKAPFDFEAVMDDEIAAIIARIFADDYLAFGYKPPVSTPVIVTEKPAPDAQAELPSVPPAFAKSGVRKQILAGRKDRLGMRLAIILQAWHFGRQTGYQTVALWPSSEINREQDDERDPLQYPISDFFDIEATLLNIGDDSIVFRDAFFPPKRKFVDKDPALAGQFPGRFKRDAVSELPPVMHVRGQAVGLRFTDEKAEDVRKSCGSLFRKLVPVPEVRAATADLAAWIGTPAFTAIHLRRGDIMRAVRRLVSEFDPGAPPPVNLRRYLAMLRSKLAPLSSVVAILQSDALRNSKVVVFSDCPETSQRMCSLLEGWDCVRICDHPTPQANDNQRSLAEFITLANSSTLVGTQSAFSRCAHFVGEGQFIDATLHRTPRENAITVLDELCGDLFSTRPDLRAACHGIME
jgi:hypothetical protein